MGRLLRGERERARLTQRALAEWICALPNCLRWSERWRDFSGYDVERDDPQIARVVRRVAAQSAVGRVGPSTSSASTIV